MLVDMLNDASVHVAAAKLSLSPVHQTHAASRISAP